MSHEIVLQPPIAVSHGVLECMARKKGTLMAISMTRQMFTMPVRVSAMGRPDDERYSGLLRLLAQNGR